MYNIKKQLDSFYTAMCSKTLFLYHIKTY